MSLARMTWPTWLRLGSLRRSAAAPRTPAPPGGIRRMDLYVLAVLALVAVVWFTHRSRYTVTHYQVEQNLAYQRTDTWTGRTELWIVGRTARPQWIGFTDAIQRPAQRRPTGTASTSPVPAAPGTAATAAAAAPAAHR